MGRGINEDGMRWSAEVGGRAHIDYVAVGIDG